MTVNSRLPGSCSLQGQLLRLKVGLHTARLANYMIILAILMQLKQTQKLLTQTVDKFNIVLE